jgi:hypothetical protein
MEKISWRPYYDMIIDEKQANLILNANILMNEDYLQILKKASISLISGKGRFLTDRRERGAPMMAEEAGPPREESLEDYHIYHLSEITLMPTVWKTLETFSFPIEKIYYAYLEGSEVNYRYDWIAPNYLPSGDIFCYRGFDGFLDAYLSQGTIKESQKDDKVKLDLGRTTKVSYEMTQEIKETATDEFVIRNYLYRVKIVNRFPESIHFEIRFRTFEIIDSADPPYRQEKEEYVWDIDVDHEISKEIHLTTKKIKQSPSV